MRFVGTRTIIYLLLILLVIIYNFNLVWTRFCPYETNTILVINSNTMLPFSITRQSFKFIFWRNF